MVEQFNGGVHWFSTDVQTPQHSMRQQGDVKQDPQILGATVQYLVTLVTSRPGYAHPELYASVFSIVS
jgi:hypothetical protein